MMNDVVDTLGEPNQIVNAGKSAAMSCPQAEGAIVLSGGAIPKVISMLVLGALVPWDLSKDVELSFRVNKGWQAFLEAEKAVDFSWFEDCDLKAVCDMCGVPYHVPL